MADFKACWLKTAHDRHGWTEVVNGDTTRLVSMVDASTVLSVPGARYHLCEGVRDVLEATRTLPRIIQDKYHSDDLHQVEVHTVGNIRVRTERLVTLTGIYQRVVREDAGWKLLQQLTCFCCSCDREGDDMFCRNHGGEYGMRPCEQHGVEGSSIVDLDEEDTGIMPESVQKWRARNSAVAGGTED